MKYEYEITISEIQLKMERNMKEQHEMEKTYFKTHPRKK